MLKTTCHHSTLISSPMGTVPNVKFTRKIALITGGSRGIGRAIAIRLAEQGADVIVNYVRHKGDARDTVIEVEKLDRKCLLLKANVANNGDVQKMFSAIADDFGHMDILVSNAASGVLKPALELTERHWNWAMDINARAPADEAGK